MRIKLDENLSQRLRIVLEGLGHDTDTVVSEQLSGSSDVNVLKAHFLRTDSSLRSTLAFWI